MANLRGLIPSDKELTPEEEQKIGDMQNEIDAIWSHVGNYEIDPDAWKQMPLFMENISEEDVAKNESCAAISSVVYEEMPAEEVALGRKEHGNECLKRAMDPAQVNKDNMARAAVHCFTEGLTAAKAVDAAVDKTLVAQLYTNRSMAHFIMKNYGHALQDAQRGVLVDPSYPKSYYHGAKAADKVRKFDIAVRLLQQGHKNVKDEKALADLKTMENTIRASMEALIKKEKQDRLKTRVDAAETSNILRAITSKGVKVSVRSEVGSEQMSQLEQHKPYFGKSDDVLYIPILFMYDEFSLTDFMRDVSTELCLAESLDEMMPFPWDTEKRYVKLDDVVAVYKLDDGVAMPEYHVVDLGYPLIEVMRGPNYQMPRLLPVFHIISKHSDKYIDEWKIRGQLEKLGVL